MLLISRPSDACSGGIWGSPHEQHGSPGTSAEGHKVPPGGRSLPRSAAQNERGVAEKRYHLGQHDAMGSGNPVLLRVLQVQGDHSTSSLSFR